MGISTAVRGLNWGVVTAAKRRVQVRARHAERALATALLRDCYRVTPEGVIVLDDFRLRGTYRHRVPGREPEYQYDHNLLVDEGILKTLGVMYYTDAKLSTWYLAMHIGTATPTSSLTAATYASTMNEITSLSEGYSNATRPTWTPAAPASNAVDNYASEATFNIATASSVTVQGAALISDSVRGGTTGTLASCAKFTNARQLFNGEPFGLGYEISLTD